MAAIARNSLMGILAAQAGSLTLARGLYLGGSFGRGIADDWSDLDYVAVAGADDVGTLADAFTQLVADQVPLVYTARRVFAGTALVNLITCDWVRVDLLVEGSDRFALRARDRLQVVFERAPLYDALPAETAIPEVRPATLSAAVEEFLRVLGLSHLAAHRADPFTAQWGVALLRDQMRLFVVALEPEAGLSGALTLSRELSSGRMALLADAPVGGADLPAILAAQAGLARRFLPFARAECARVNAAWPGSFITATAAVLRGVMEDAFCDWLARQAIE